MHVQRMIMARGVVILVGAIKQDRQRLMLGGRPLLVLFMLAEFA